jgi:predicted acetyltransferase
MVDAALPDGLTLRPVTPPEFARFHLAVERTFLSDVNEHDREREQAIFEFDRSLAVWDGAEPVATIAAYSLEMTLPGGPRPVAGVSQVSVQPTYRRRGLLRTLMTQGLADLHERGREAVAALWATEPGIYGRFGYGSANRVTSVTVRRGEGAFGYGAPEATGRLRLGEPGAERPALQAVLEAVRPHQVGLFARDDRWWDNRTFDPESRRAGSSPLMVVVHEGDDGPEGYALYSTAARWDDWVPRGTVDVREILTRTPQAATALWRYLLDTDLVAELQAWNLPLDSPLLHLVADARRARPVVRDNLHVRLVDLPRALAERSYAADVDVVLAVRDRTAPWNDGRWRVSGGPGGGTCAATTDPADLSLDVRELGAVHLGGTTLGELARAGLVQEHRAGAVAASARAWALPADQPAPWCPMVF